IGIDLLREIAREKAQTFSGLDRGAYQYDAFHPVACHGVDGAGDGEVGLTGTRGADPERDVVVLDLLQIFDLTRSAAMQVTSPCHQCRHAVDGDRFWPQFVEFDKTKLYLFQIDRFFSPKIEAL